MKTKLNISFKGDRNYLHGSDFFNALSSNVEKIVGDSHAYVSRIVFKRFSRTTCEIWIDEKIDLSSVVATVRFTLQDGSQIDGWIVETGGAINEKREVDEDSLTIGAKVDRINQQAVLCQRSIHSPIEEVIALVKQLNYAVCPEVKGKWVFGQLELTQPLRHQYQRLEIKMKSLMAGRYSVNQVIIDGVVVGIMKFIVGSPS